MAARRRVRRFKVGRRIGQGLTVLGVVDGGPHPVYIVWSDEDWCPLACKVLRTARRASEEAEIIQACAHPNIVRLFACQDDLLVMEFLDGPTLQRMLEDRPNERLSRSEALRSVIHVGAALQHVHARGYVHLDIKPQNVIVVGGRPVLHDFGTARRIGGKRPSIGVGTTSYMPPEEAEKGEVSPASDVYSLGVTLFELLTGHFPFPPRSRGRPYPQLKLEPKTPRKYLPSLPRRLEELIMASIARDPGERPHLSQLLPELNGMITAGPKMWPDEFDPLAPRRRPGKAVAG